MIKNALSLSQPLNSMSYNEHLAKKMQGNQASNGTTSPMNMQQVMGMGQGSGSQNILDQAGFASELRSQKTVSALMHATQGQNNNGQNAIQNTPTNNRNIEKNQINSNTSISIPLNNNSLYQQPSISMHDRRQNAGQSATQTAIPSSGQDPLQNYGDKGPHPLQNYVDNRNLLAQNTMLTQQNTQQSMAQNMQGQSVNAQSTSLLGATLGEMGGYVDAQGALHIPSTMTNANPQHAMNGQSQISGNTTNPQMMTAAEEAAHRRMVSNAIPLKDDSMGIPLKNSVTIPINNQNHAEAQAQGSTANNMQLANTGTSLQTHPSQGIAINTRRAFALDSRSLGILNRVSQRNTQNRVTGASDNNPTSSQILPHLAHSGAMPQTQIQNLLEGQKLGSISKQYESGSLGSAAIGYDRNGGTSYGTYQISSRAGTFTDFLKYLDTNAPDWAEKLRSAGKANTGSKHGAVPTVWKELCAENPERMEDLEYNFILKTHYEPVANYVEETWKGDVSTALQEVIFSTAVQHGVTGAKNVFSQAFAKTPVEDMNNQASLIKNVYDNRSNKFGSSTLQVQQAAQNRMVNEQKEALAQLI